MYGRPSSRRTPPFVPSQTRLPCQTSSKHRPREATAPVAVPAARLLDRSMESADLAQPSPRGTPPYRYRLQTTGLPIPMTTASGLLQGGSPWRLQQPRHPRRTRPRSAPRVVDFSCRERTRSDQPPPKSGYGVRTSAPTLDAVDRSRPNAATRKSRRVALRNLAREGTALRVQRAERPTRCSDARDPTRRIRHSQNAWRESDSASQEATQLSFR